MNKDAGTSRGFLQEALGAGGSGGLSVKLRLRETGQKTDLT